MEEEEATTTTTLSTTSSTEMMMENELNIRIKMLDERVVCINTNKDISIPEFRKQIEQATQVPIDLQRLIYRGKLIRDTSPTLGTYAIQDGHTIHLVAKRIIEHAENTSPTAQAERNASHQMEHEDRASSRFSTTDTSSSTSAFANSRERLRRLIDQVGALRHLTEEGPSMNPLFGVRRPPVITRRIEPNSILSGEATNLRILREVLRSQNHQSLQPQEPDGNTGTFLFGSTSVNPPIQSSGFRQGLDTSTTNTSTFLPSASSIQLDTTTSHLTSQQNDQPINLDYLQQGILTLRTVLSTVAIPPNSIASSTTIATSTCTSHASTDLYETIQRQSSSPSTTIASELQDMETTDEVEVLQQDEGLRDTIARSQESLPSSSPRSLRLLDQTEATAPSQSTAGHEQTITPLSSTRRHRRGRRQFYVGQWIDVKDTVNQWLECTVMDISEDKILVHYHGWPNRWDEWIDFDSDRLAAFRTRTRHTLNAQTMSPIPSTRLQNAPSLNGNGSSSTNIRTLMPQVRDIMRDILPHVEALAALCGESSTTDDEETQNEEIYESGHLVAPLFDRLGRLLMDTAQAMDPILDPAFRRCGRQPATGIPEQQATSMDSSCNIRQLISTSTASTPLDNTNNQRRNIDVHIQAIVAPPALSSLAVLSRLAALGGGGGGMGSMGGLGISSTSNGNLGGLANLLTNDFGSNPSTVPFNRPRSLESDLARTSSNTSTAFGSPSIRPRAFPDAEFPLLNDLEEPDIEDATTSPTTSRSRATDQSRMPLLGSYRSSNHHLFGDSDEEEEDNFGGYHRYLEISSPPGTVRQSPTPVERRQQGITDLELDDDEEVDNIQPESRDENFMLGIIPEVAAAENATRRNKRDETMPRETTEANDFGNSVQEIDNGILGQEEQADGGESGETTRSNGPTFLEVLRRTLSSVRRRRSSSNNSSTSDSNTGTCTARTNRRSSRSSFCMGSSGDDTIMNSVSTSTASVTTTTTTTTGKTTRGPNGITRSDSVSSSSSSSSSDLSAGILDELD